MHVYCTQVFFAKHIEHKLNFRTARITAHKILCSSELHKKGLFGLQDCKNNMITGCTMQGIFRVPNYPYNLSLLETRALPRARGFAEGQISGTRQRHSLPRASHRSPRQRTALGKEAFAEGTALGKDRPTANQIFAEGRGPRQRCPRQIRPVGSRQPFSVELCRGPPVRPSVKIFFL